MKVYFKNKNFIIFLFSTNLFYAFLKDCNKTEPILKDNYCQLIYCEQSKFNTNECSINNTIIKTQWLNDIIRISDDYFRYINVVSNKNGDIFIETSPVTQSSKRIFYGLKTNGRFYFQNEDTPFYILNEMDRGLKRHYSELYNIVLSNDQEYLLSISTEGYVEIYDFDNNERKYTPYSDFV
jgi:WD40 repeat protein